MPNSVNIEYESVAPEHVDELARIRIAAMHESLNRIGRFDPERARDRFIANFNPEYTRFINYKALRVGFVVVKPELTSLKLDHLYIEPSCQGLGIGAAVLRDVFATADAQALPVMVTALRESDSNRFYLKHGFRYLDESEWDINYVRTPQAH